jgi:hypothetical protein
MGSTAGLHSETLRLLRSLRSFILHLPRRVPERNELIHSLLQASSEAFVWPQRKGSKLRPYPTDFVTPERGRFRLDPSKVIFTGYGPFWHLDDRGSIAMRMPRLPQDLDAVFQRCPLHPGCTEHSIISSRNMLAKGNSSGAIRYCEQLIDSGEYAFLLPVGTQYVALFAQDDELFRLYRLAQKLCRPWNVNNTYFTISECHLA